MQHDDIIPSCFQKINYEFLKAYLVLCPVNQPFNILQRLGINIKNKKPEISLNVAGAFAAIISLIIFTGSTGLCAADREGIVPGKNAIKVALSCTNGYTIAALYYSPDENKVMQKLLLTVSKKGALSNYDMLPAMSASGARFENAKNNLSFWEHQGDFNLAKGGTAILTVCRKSQDKIVNRKLSEVEALAIAKVSCIKGGGTLGSGMYNENSQTWWFDANFNSKRKGCNPACVVSEKTKTAEINWRCTGLINPDHGQTNGR